MATEPQNLPNRYNDQSNLVVSLSSVICRLSSVICPLSSVFCPLLSVVRPLHLSRTLYKSTLFMQNKPNFLKAIMNATSLITMNYENKSNRTLGENKPNSNPIKPNFQKAQMNVNSLITKDYRKNDAFAVQKNKPNSNPISERPK